MAEIFLEEVNRAAACPEATVHAAEEAYHAHIGSVAERIVADRSVCVLLLAGPSGAGKTTTANLLADALRVRRRECSVVSLDNFYREGTDPLYPLTPEGKRDAESADALNLAMVADCVGKITRGEPFAVPRYDFRTASYVGEGYRFPPVGDGCVILEGLHALNPRICGGLDTGRVLRMFVSVSTNINEGDRRILSGRKIRFVRRLVRDHLYRGASAKRTLEMWSDVLAGEDKYLYPYRDTADITFDTFHTFELPVLKPYAEEVLGVEPLGDPYSAAVMDALGRIQPMDISFVPEDSLIREFIPGGIYENLY